MRESSNKVLSIDRGNVIGRMEAYDQANIFQHVYDFTQSTNPRKLSPLESEIKDIFNSPFGGGIEGPSSRLKPRKIKTPTYSAQAKYQGGETKGNHEWKQNTLAGENYKKIVEQVPGVVLRRYNAITGKGALNEEQAKSFSGGRYTTIELTKDLRAFRAWTPGQSNEFGAYWSLEKPTGSLATRINSALIPEWGFVYPGKVHIAQANQYTEIVIPAGTIIHIGEVGSQSQRGAFVGSGSQLLIKGGAKPDWVVGRGKLQ